jgi:putative transposase
MNTNYNILSHEKFKMQYHIIFSTKYRKNILINNIADSVKKYMIKATENQSWSIELMEIDSQKPNHIHFLINSNPNITVKSIVNRLKQFSTFYI